MPADEVVRALVDTRLPVPLLLKQRSTNHEDDVLVLLPGGRAAWFSSDVIVPAAQGGYVVIEQPAIAVGVDTVSSWIEVSPPEGVNWTIENLDSEYAYLRDLADPTSVYRALAVDVWMVDLEGRRTEAQALCQLPIIDTDPSSTWDDFAIAFFGVGGWIGRVRSGQRWGFFTPPKTEAESLTTGHDRESSALSPSPSNSLGSDVPAPAPGEEALSAQAPSRIRPSIEPGDSAPVDNTRIQRPGAPGVVKPTAAQERYAETVARGRIQASHESRSSSRSRQSGEATPAASTSAPSLQLPQEIRQNDRDRPKGKVDAPVPAPQRTRAVSHRELSRAPEQGHGPSPAQESHSRSFHGRKQEPITGVLRHTTTEEARGGPSPHYAATPSGDRRDRLGVDDRADVERESERDRTRRNTLLRRIRRASATESARDEGNPASTLAKVDASRPSTETLLGLDQSHGAVPLDATGRLVPGRRSVVRPTPAPIPSITAPQPKRPVHGPPALGSIARIRRRTPGGEAREHRYEVQRAEVLLGDIAVVFGSGNTARAPQSPESAGSQGPRARETKTGSLLAEIPSDRGFIL